MIRLPSRRATLSWLAASALLAGTGCLDDRGFGPDGPSARLTLRAQFGAVAVTGLRLEGSYLRSDQSSGAFTSQTLPLPADRSPGAQATLPVTLDLASCLADPLAVPGNGACTVTLALVLLDGSREVDRAVIGPLVLRPGGTATPEAVQLREASNVDVTAPAAVTCVNPGQTLQLAARLLDAAGDELTGRPFVWATNAPAVATVDAATGLVTGVALGSAAITASAGGRTGQITITVCPTARIALAPAAVSFEWWGESARPDAAQVAVTNQESGPLAGLSVGSIVYAGPVTNWLTATLSSAGTPATLTLRPSRTNLADGIYTAAVPVVSAGAANSPQTVMVTYAVRDLSNYLLFIDAGEEAEFVESGQSVSMRAVVLDQQEEELDGVPVSWSVAPANAGTLQSGSTTDDGAVYQAGSHQGTVVITVTAGPLSASLVLQQNSFVTLREPPTVRRRSATTTTPARTRAPGGTP